MKTLLRIYLLFFMFYTSSSSTNDGSSKIERNVPLVVVDSFYSVFLLKIQSGFRNTRARIIKN
jgi:hypothetical protein